MKNKYAVLGDPVDHSWSPFIHQSFAKQFSFLIEYEKIKVSGGTLGDVLPLLVSKNYLGLNITVPLKQEAFQLALSKNWKLSGRAAKSKAINTLFFKNNEVFADNTDGVGLFRNLDHYGFSKIVDGNVLIVGAGGAVRGILPMFSTRKFNKVMVVNRSSHNLLELSEIFTSSLFSYLTIDDFNQTEREFLKFDLIINATSASITGANVNIPQSLFFGCPLVVDLFYSSENTPFMKFALMSGANNVIDGLGMLVEQAAESFYVWTKHKPNTRKVLNKIRFEMLNQ